jgi:acyl-CoA hydrolase
MTAAKQIDFLAPVLAGALLNLTAAVAHVGRASLKVQLEAYVDGAPRERPTVVQRNEFERVTVNEKGRPILVGPPEPLRRQQRYELALDAPAT